ncbi:MAG: zinc ribbon domain-containing protein [Acidimicrobiales bacterium]
MTPTGSNERNNEGSLGTMLLELQRHDSEIDALEYTKITLPERVALGNMRERIGEISRKVGELKAEKDSIRMRQDELELQVNTAVQRKQALEQKLYSGEAPSPRDLEAMDTEAHHLASRAEELQDRQFELMEALESLESKYTDLQEEMDQLSVKSDQLVNAANNKLSGIDSQLSACRSRRKAAAKRIPGAILQRYDAIRSRAGGVGAAALVAGKCSGCHLVVSVASLSASSAPTGDSLDMCENCGRFLVVI